MEKTIKNNHFNKRTVVNNSKYDLNTLATIVQLANSNMYFYGFGSIFKRGFSEKLYYYLTMAACKIYSNKTLSSKYVTLLKLVDISRNKEYSLNEQLSILTSLELMEEAKEYDDYEKYVYHFNTLKNTLDINYILENFRSRGLQSFFS